MKTIALVFAMLISVCVYSQNNDKLNKYFKNYNNEYLSLNINYFISESEYRKSTDKISLLESYKIELEKIKNDISLNNISLNDDISYLIYNSISLNNISLNDDISYLICNSIIFDDYDVFYYLLNQPINDYILELAFMTSIDILHRETYYDILVDKIDLNVFDYMNHVILKYNDYAINDLINHIKTTYINPYFSSIEYAITNNNINPYFSSIEYTITNNNIVIFNKIFLNIFEHMNRDATTLANNNNIERFKKIFSDISITLLIHSLDMKRYNIAKIIMEHCIDTTINNYIMYDYIINNKDYKTIDTTISLFHLACIVGDLETVKIECNNGFVVDSYDRYGMTGLMYACVNSNVDVVEYLINKADICLINKFNKELFETSNIKEFVNYENIENETKILKISERNRKISDIIMTLNSNNNCIFTDFYKDKTIDCNIKIVNPNIYYNLLKMF